MIENGWAPRNIFVRKTLSSLRTVARGGLRREAARRNVWEQRVLTKIILIAAGGGLGPVLRYVIAGWGQKWAGGSFPFGTLIVNVIGCFLIGCLRAAFDRPTIVREEYRIAILVGLLGGFTTFSTFALETLALTNDRQFKWAASNILASVGMALAAVWFGYRVVEKLMGL